MVFTYAAIVPTLRKYKFKIITVNIKYFFFYLKESLGITSYSEHLNFDVFTCLINYQQCNSANKPGLDPGSSGL